MRVRKLSYPEKHERANGRPERYQPRTATRQPDRRQRIPRLRALPSIFKTPITKLPCAHLDRLGRDNTLGARRALPSRARKRRRGPRNNQYVLLE